MLVVGRIEFWGGKALPVSLRIVRDDAAVLTSQNLQSILSALLATSPAPDDLIPSFDFDEMHRRNSSVIFKGV